MKTLECGRDRNGVPVVSAMSLEYFAEDLVEDFNPQLLRSPQPTDIERFAECYMGANLEIRPITMTRAILGVTVFDGGCVPVYDRMAGSLVPLEVPERTILIEEGIYNRHEPGRYNFTLAHESAGHLACHANIPMNSGAIPGSDVTGTVFMCRPEGERYPRHGIKSPHDWLEWQADYCGAAVLMPRKTFVMALESTLWNEGFCSVGYGKDEITRSPRLFSQVSAKLAQVFNVSHTAAAIRMEGLGYRRT